MSFSIKGWLDLNYIELSNFKNLSLGHLDGLALRIVSDASNENCSDISAFDICLITEVLEHPLTIHPHGGNNKGIALEELPVFLKLVGIWVEYLNQRRPFSRAEATWLAFQMAFLAGLKQVITAELNLNRDWLQKATIPLHSRNNILSKNTQLQSLLKNFSSISLNDTQANQVLYEVANSWFAMQMNGAGVIWLVANGAEEKQAKLILQRLFNSFEGHLLEVTINNLLPFAQLQKFVKLDIEALKVDSSEGPQICADRIDIYREYYRASLLQSLSQPLFTEFFALKDIYVNLRGILITTDCVVDSSTNKTVDLQEWAQQQLADTNNIAVIESDSGFGKTSFCQIWTTHIAINSYPEWMPILISLKKIKYSDRLAETLSFSLPEEYRANFKIWLEQNRPEKNHPRCLLILDGWDELPSPPPENRNAKSFLMKQLLQFQSQGNHKVFITAIPNSFIPEELLETLESKCSCQRIAIAKFGQEELRQWFQNWAKVQSGSSAQNCFNFLKGNGAFSKSPVWKYSAENRLNLNEDVIHPKSTLENRSSENTNLWGVQVKALLTNLVRQPLTLYLIAILHRDGYLDSKLLDPRTLDPTTNLSVDSFELEWEIHQGLYKLLLGYPLSDGTQAIFSQVTKKHIYHLRGSFVSENLHSSHVNWKYQSNGNAYNKATNIATTIDDIAQSMLFCNSDRIICNSEDINNNSDRLITNQTLPTFYFSAEAKLPINSKKYYAIEFSHSRLGEYLKAKIIANQLSDIVQISQSPDYSTRVAQKIYNFLGYGILTQRLEGFVIAILRQKQQDDDSLFPRLNLHLQEFWLNYCQGKWFDEGIVHQALQHFRKFHNPIGVEQINAAVGFNIFLLFSALQKEIKAGFLPYSYGNDKFEIDTQALKMLISRMETWSVNGFAKYLYRRHSLACLNLSKVNLSYTILNDISLEKANLANSKLINANLMRVNFNDTNLSGANLSGANLTQANLSGANLSNANLWGANLTGVNLENNVNLTNTCLSKAILSEENKEIATINGAVFSLEEWNTAHNLNNEEADIDPSDTLSDADTWLYKVPHIGKIESAEGEPLVPVDLHENLGEDETLFRADTDEFE